MTPEQIIAAINAMAPDNRQRLAFLARTTLDGVRAFQAMVYGGGGDEQNKKP